MQVGDKIVVVGPEDAVDRVASLMGNSVKRLDHPNLVTIFVGILVGIIFGSIPFAFPRRAHAGEARFGRRSADCGYFDRSFRL